MRAFQLLAILYSMVELSPMFRIIEFYTTDPHKAYFTHIRVIYELFSFVHFHKDTK